jgi:hypothetical protein
MMLLSFLPDICEGLIFQVTDDKKWQMPSFVPIAMFSRSPDDAEVCDTNVL